MKIATIIFAYNRPKHIKRVIDGLKGNSIIPEKLFVFHDGKNEDTDDNDWNEVELLLHRIDWCDRELITAKTNKGLAKSVVDGLNYVFDRYDAVIVLEDDCVPMPGFMNYMNQALEFYINEEKVYSIGGYSWPVDIDDSEFDAYFEGRAPTWGWGTWKNRWAKYQEDYLSYRRLKFSERGSFNLARWGRGLESMLINNVIGQGNSWAVFWALTIIENEGVCLAPYKSLIENIGFDGTGVHCGSTEEYAVMLEETEKTNFRFPDTIKISEKCVEAFTKLFGSYTFQSDPSAKPNITIYGVGSFFFEYEREINEKYNIENLFDTSRKGYYAGIRINKPSDKLKNCSKLLLLVKDINSCFDVCKKIIIEHKVAPSKISLGLLEFGKLPEDIDVINVVPDGSWEIIFKNTSIAYAKDESEFMDILRH